jgi:hypothetical protein
MSGRIKDKETGLRLPRLGLIKIGEKDPQRGYPRSLDYFIATGKYAYLFNNKFSKPQKLYITFFTDNTEISCEHRYELWKGAKKVAYGDGETFFAYDKKEGVYKKVTVQEAPEIKKQIEKHFGEEFSEVLHLRFIIPQIEGILGYWEFSTKAKQSTIPNIIGTYDTIMEQNGFVKGVIFELTVEKVVSRAPDSKSKFPVVSLIPNQTEDAMNAIGNSLFNINPKQLNDGSKKDSH